MRYLVDECTGPTVARWLRSLGHEVFSVHDDARGMSDKDVLEKAASENWILITNDKDFGEMIFRRQQKHCGVILLRLEDERSTKKIEVLKQLLEQYSERLPNRFVTVTEKQVRFSGD